MIWRAWVGIGALLGVCAGLTILGEIVRPMVVPLFAIFILATLFVVPYRGRARRS